MYIYIRGQQTFAAHEGTFYDRRTFLGVLFPSPPIQKKTKQQFFPSSFLMAPISILYIHNIRFLISIIVLSFRKRARSISGVVYKSYFDDNTVAHLREACGAAPMGGVTHSFRTSGITNNCHPHLWSMVPQRRIGCRRNCSTRLRRYNISAAL